MARSLTLTTAAALMLLIGAGTVWAKPGPTVVGVSERVEYHSKTANANSAEFGNDLYLYSMLFFARRLDTGVTGTLAYIQQYGLRDNKPLANIANISLAKKLGIRWQATTSYSYLSRNKMTSQAQITADCSLDASGIFNCARSNSDWLGFGMEYNTNPDGQAPRTWKAAVAYNTTTDFSYAASIVPKISFRSRITPRYEWETAIQPIYNMKGSAAINKGFTANQYFLTLDIKAGQMDKVQLQYLYIDNIYDNNPGDDNVFRVNYMHLFKR